MAKKPAVIKRPVGKPPAEFKPEYCQMLIDHMAKGKSFESFGAVVNYGRTTLYEWATMYPDFADAKKRATEKNLDFWEDAGVEGIWDVTTVTQRNGDQYTTRKLNAAVWIYNMKCRHRELWNDNKELKIGAEGKTRLVIHMGNDDDDTK